MFSLVQSAKQTMALGQALAQEISKSPVLKTGAFVIALEGDLGAGKTVFAQGFALGLGVKERVLSPTFVLMKKFPLYGKRFKNLYHFDAYRLESEKDIGVLELTEIFSTPKNIILIEWPERIERALPKKRINIKIRYQNNKGKNARVIDIFGNLLWQNKKIGRTI